MSEDLPPLRADAARNRARVLEVAYEAFAEGGLSVPIDEIARRAGVGAGTVYRHFPTKEALVSAVASNRLQQLVDRADEFTAAKEPGDAFFAYLDVLIEEGRFDRGLVETLAGIGIDIAGSIPESEQRFLAVVEALLIRAQRAGAVRADIGVRDVKALLVGCQAMQASSDEPETVKRTIAVIRDGLKLRNIPVPHGAA